MVTPDTYLWCRKDIMTEEDTQTAKQLPEPKGYKLLIALPEPDEMTEGGILKA